MAASPYRFCDHRIFLVVIHPGTPDCKIPGANHRAVIYIAAWIVGKAGYPTTTLPITAGGLELEYPVGC